MLLCCTNNFTNSCRSNVSIQTFDILIYIIVRLVGDPTPPFSYGRVEVLINGTWGTFCSSALRWNLQNAHVICRQLGFDGAVTASSSGGFGEGTGSKWANNLQCLGNETSISECKHNKWMSVRSCGFAQAHSANSAMCKQPGKCKTSPLRIRSPDLL